MTPEYIITVEVAAGLHELDLDPDELYDFADYCMAVVDGGAPFYLTNQQVPALAAPEHDAA